MAALNIRRVAHAVVIPAIAAGASTGLAAAAARPAATHTAATRPAATRPAATRPANHPANVSSLVSARAASAAPARLRILGGLTSQGWPVVASVSKDGRRIAVIRLGLMMNCGTGGSFAVIGGDNQLRIGGNGKLALRGSWQQTSGTLTILAMDVFTGRINRARTSLAGTWDLHVSFRDSTTSQTSECDSGRVTFDA